MNNYHVLTGSLITMTYLDKMKEWLKESHYDNIYSAGDNEHEILWKFCRFLDEQAQEKCNCGESSPASVVDHGKDSCWLKGTRPQPPKEEKPTCAHEWHEEHTVCRWCDAKPPKEEKWHKCYKCGINEAPYGIQFCLVCSTKPPKEEKPLPVRIERLREGVRRQDGLLPDDHRVRLHDIEKKINELVDALNNQSYHMNESKPQDWEKKINLLIAQSAPFTLMESWHDADFAHLKDGIRSLIEATRREELEWVLEQKIDVRNYTKGAGFPIWQMDVSAIKARLAALNNQTYE